MKQKGIPLDRGKEGKSRTQLLSSGLENRKESAQGLVPERSEDQNGLGYDKKAEPEKVLGGRVPVGKPDPKRAKTPQKGHLENQATAKPVPKEEQTPKRSPTKQQQSHPVPNEAQGKGRSDCGGDPAQLDHAAERPEEDDECGQERSFQGKETEPNSNHSKFENKAASDHPPPGAIPNLLSPIQRPLQEQEEQDPEEEHRAKARVEQLQAGLDWIQIKQFFPPERKISPSNGGTEIQRRLPTQPEEDSPNLPEVQSRAK